MSTIKIPYGRQEITQDDVDAVVAVLRSDFLTQGPAVPRFERAVADYCGAEYAVAVNSATSALHIACLALGLQRGDRLWTSPITFVASANCALYCGASVDFVDIDPITSNICPKALERKLIAAAHSGTLPKVVVAVHLTGEPCEMSTISSLAEKYGFSVIEDASHAIGAHYQGSPVGKCQFSDIVIFSFHPVKVITTGEGGMALTQDPELAAKMALLRSHGITREPTFMTKESDGPWYYQQIDLGFNYRMTELQAALGGSQLSRLDAYVQRRSEIARQYDEALIDLPLALPFRHPENRSALHLYVVRLSDDFTWRRRAIFEKLRLHGVGVNIHYIPVHTQPFYIKMGFKEGDYPNSESYYKSAISLPMFPSLKDEEQATVIELLTSAIGG